MKRTILATCLAGACAVALSAQTPTQQPPPTSTAGTTGATTDTTGGQRTRGGPMTITGCLKAGDTAGTYMLTNVQGMGHRPGAGGGAGDTTGAGGTTAGATTTSPQGGQGRGMNEVMLTATSDVDLKPHVGHKIEVTGTPARGAGQGSGATTTGEGTAAGGAGTAGTATGGTAAGGATTATTGRGAPRSMNVTSIKMISDSCSQQ